MISLLTNPPNVPPSAAGSSADAEEEGEKETVGRIVMADLVQGFKKSVDERKWMEIRLMVSEFLSFRKGRGEGESSRELS